MSRSPLVADLRSDTLTRPTAGMRAAMAEAEVGDDVYGEDPSVNALEAEMAALLGKEAALFVPTGTMGNQICVRLLVPPAGELLCDADAHIVTYENGGAAQHGSVQTRTLVSARGLLDPDAVAAQVRPEGWGTVVTSAVAVEHTHNRGGGAVYPLETLRRLRAVTTERGAALHCDGARIFNAHVASGVPLATYGELFDAMSVCLSKGLGAPVGSVVLAGAEAIARGRVLRHRLGGAMRQAGIIAAAGRYAIAHHIERLAEDHRRAKELATAIADKAPGTVDPARVETNIVLIDTTGSGHDATSLTAAAAEEGVLVGVVAPRQVRLVTHLDVDDEGCARAAEVLSRLLAG
ncbi:MAG: threonine aldolase family protein [Frankiaceae bacterium]